jgi:hypothetical protein
MPPCRFPVSASLAYVLLAGCAEPLPTEPSDKSGIPRLRASMTGACSQGTFTQFSASQWGCGQLVEFHTSATSLRLSLEAAVGAWGTRLQSTGFSDLPRFTTTNTVGDKEATATGTGEGQAFCGSWDDDTKTLTVIASANCTSGLSVGSLYSLLLHEVGHAVGWTGRNTHKDLPEHCVMHLPDDRTINGSICTHEIEGVLAGYGLVSYPADEFFSTPFVVGSTSGLAPRTLAVADTARLIPGGYRLELGGEVADTESQYSWSSSDNAVVTVSGGLVTALSPGIAMVRAIPLTGSGYFLAHPFRTLGVSALITVTAPPPPPPEILLDQVPVWEAGYHTFTYVGPGSTGLLTWHFDDSRTIDINPDTSFTTLGGTATVYISAGSYKLWVAVAGVGQGFPVCTGTGGLSRRNDKGIPETDAVANCPPPEQE